MVTTGCPDTQREDAATDRSLAFQSTSAQRGRRFVGQQMLILLSVVIGLLAVCVASWQRMTPLAEERVLPQTWVGDLRAGIVVGQSFIASHTGLCRIDVWLAPKVTDNTQDILFHLKTDRQAEQDLVTLTANARDVHPDAYHTFAFPPIANSAGRSFYFYLESPDSTSANAVTVWGTEEDAYPEGKADAGPASAVTKGDLAFVAYYQPGIAETADILLDRLTANKPLIWGDRRFYLLLAITYCFLFIKFILAVRNIIANDQNEL